MIKVLRDATVVANALTAARAEAAESVTVADAETATCPARGRADPPVAVAFRVPPDAGIYKVYALIGSVDVPRASDANEYVLKLTAVVVSEPLPAAVDNEIPPVANRSVHALAGTGLPAESSTDTSNVAFSPGA